MWPLYNFVKVSLHSNCFLWCHSLFWFGFRRLHAHCCKFPFFCPKESSKIVVVFLARKVKLSIIKYHSRIFCEIKQLCSVLCISLQRLPAKLGKLKSEELIIDCYDEVEQTGNPDSYSDLHLMHIHDDDFMMMMLIFINMFNQ